MQAELKFLAIFLPCLLTAWIIDILQHATTMPFSFPIFFYFLGIFASTIASLAPLTYDMCLCSFLPYGRHVVIFFFTVIKDRSSRSLFWNISVAWKELSYHLADYHIFAVAEGETEKDTERQERGLTLYLLFLSYKCTNPVMSSTSS